MTNIITPIVSTGLAGRITAPATGLTTPSFTTPGGVAGIMAEVGAGAPHGALVWGLAVAALTGLHIGAGTTGADSRAFTAHGTPPGVTAPVSAADIATAFTVGTPRAVSAAVA